MSPDPAHAPPSAPAAKYLTFEVADSVYGVDILAVQEIIRLMPVTGIPKAPPFVRGVVNLRGEVIAVLDLRARFELPPGADNDRSCIVVLQLRGADGTQVTRGVVVDKVMEVLSIPADRLEAPPALGARSDTSFIRALGKTEDRVVVILDVPSILTVGASDASAAA